MNRQLKTLAAAVMLTASALTAQNLTIGSTDSRLNLNLTGDQSKVGVALYDLAGRKLFEKSELLSAGTHGFDLPSSLASGMYIMQVDIDGKIYTNKFVPGTQLTVVKNIGKSSIVKAHTRSGTTTFVSNEFSTLGDVAPTIMSMDTIGNNKFMTIVFDVELENTEWSGASSNIVLSCKKSTDAQYVTVNNATLFGLRNDTHLTSTNTYKYWSNTDSAEINGGYVDLGVDPVTQHKRYRFYSGSVDPKILFNNSSMTGEGQFQVVVTTSGNTVKTITGHTYFNYSYVSGYGLPNSKGSAIRGIIADFDTSYLYGYPQIDDACLARSSDSLYSLARDPSTMLQHPYYEINPEHTKLTDLDTPTKFRVWMMGENNNLNDTINSHFFTLRAFYAPDSTNGNKRVYSQFTERSINELDTLGYPRWNIVDNQQKYWDYTDYYSTNNWQFPWYHPYDSYIYSDLVKDKPGACISSTKMFTLRELFNGIQNDTAYVPGKGAFYVQVGYRDAQEYFYPNNPQNLLPSPSWFLIKVNEVDLTEPEQIEKRMLDFSYPAAWGMSVDFEQICDTATVEQLIDSTTGRKDTSFQIKPKQWREITLTAARPITLYDSSTSIAKPIKGSSIERLKAVLDVTFEGCIGNLDDAGQYLGNVQLLMNENWIEQFELNTVLRMVGDSTYYNMYEDIPGWTYKKKFHARYEVVLTDEMTAILKQDTTQQFKLVIHGKPNFAITLNKLSFEDAQGDAGRILFSEMNRKFGLSDSSSVVGLLGSAVPWETYRVTHYPDSIINSILVYKDVLGVRSYYELRQDVMAPLYLAHWWSHNPAYAPGGTVFEGINWGASYPGLWRQCWNYIGHN